MSLIYNGTEIETIIYNGVQLDKLIYNGIVVWEGMPEYTAFYFNNTGSAISGERLYFYKNDTTPTYVYINNTLIDTFTTAGGQGWGTPFTIPQGESTVKIVGGSIYIRDTLLYTNTQGSLKKVVLGKNFVGELGIAFNAQTGLTELVCGPNVTEINVKCDSLSKVVLSEGLSKIGDSCFENNTGLTSVKIPDSVTTIGSRAFAFSDNISTIEISPTSNLTTIGSTAFGETLISSIYIPDTVNNIGNYAFVDCSNLITLTIPNSDCQIGRRICDGCALITDLYIYSTVTQTTKVTSYSSSYVISANANVTIHLSQSIGTIEQARELFGNYFNYLTNNTECTVVFDL